MCEFPDIYIKFPNWSCVLKFCIEYPGVFVPDKGMNYEDDANISFILFHHYKNISYCHLHKQLLTEHVKTFPSCINIQNFEKGKFTTRKGLVLKSCIIVDFYS